MKSPFFRCASWLLPLLLAGCIHSPFNRSSPARSVKLAPPLQPLLPVELAVIELPPYEIVLPAKPIYNMREQPQPIKPQVRHKKPAKDESAGADVAANANPEVNAIGQLSSGDPANLRRQTEDSIEAIERGLNGIHRTLSDPEQKTADQIREFLKQAKTALDSGDVEGAHTLASKAQILLEGLTQ
jgi:hypothetical protein